jgi:hypothetical protein
MAPNEKGGEDFIEICRILVNEAIIEVYQKKNNTAIKSEGDKNT